MNFISDLRQILQKWGDDQPELVNAVEAFARQHGDAVYQEIFRLLFDRDLDPQRAARYWREALARWDSQDPRVPGQKLLKAALFDYLQNIAGDRVGSVRDGLTGLFTPSYGRAHLDKLLAAKRSRANAPPLSILVLAIDRYQQLLNTAGQADLDRCIRQLSALLRRHIRDMDSASWLEQGRFCVILPDASRSQSYAIAERIRCAVEEETFPGTAGLPGGKLTVSTGLAGCPEDGRLPGPLLRFAEEQLALAQTIGNRCFPGEAERRRETRRKVHAPVEVAYAEHGGFMPAMALDISPCGMAIGGNLALKTGVPLTVRFQAPDWPGDRTVRALVRESSLLGNDKHPRFGLEFLKEEPLPAPFFN